MQEEKANKEVVMSEQGRPTKYKPEYDNLAYKLCLLGYTDRELAITLDVNEDTINEWKKVHLSFSESLKKGKEIADAEVVASLHKRATGYIQKAQKVLSCEGHYTDTITYDVEISPDPLACFYWLKNRQPKKWRDKQEIEQNIQGNIAFNFIEATKEDEKK